MGSVFSYGDHRAQDQRNIGEEEGVMALYGIDYLRRKLEAKRSRVLLRYQYYEMKNAMLDLRISTPDDPALQAFRSTLGWCAKAVDSLADRLQFRGFRNDDFEMETIYRMNNGDILYDNAMLSALISSCSFLFIHPDGDFYPLLQVIDGGNATGIIDPATNMLKEGYAVLERDERGNPVREAYFLPEKTIYISVDGTRKETHAAPYPLLVPVIYRPDAVRPFGHSRISRACMAIMQSALRTVKRSEISAEFYSFPQKYVLGTDPDADPIEKWRATISTMLEITKDEDGDKPVVGQFTQQSMTPHAEQLRMFAALFAGETGLTLDDLGFPSENPSSAEAIKASHESLRLTAEKAQRGFGTAFLNAGYLAACLRDNYPYLRRQVGLTTPAWMPAFRPDASALSGIGDGAIKLNQAVPGYIGSEGLYDLTGIAPEA